VPGCEGEAINSLLAAVLQRKETRGEVATLCRGYDSLRRNLEALEVSEEIWTAAEEIARAERAAFLIGPASGPADRVRGAAASLTSLAAVTGHLGRPGSGLLLLFARSNVRGACDMGVAPDRLPGYQRIDQSVAREHIERLWAKPLPREPGFDAATMLESVQGLIVVADDPAAVLPMGKQARAALERLEFLVVLDAFETPVANAAHVVLPISSFAETEGTFTSMEDRVQRIRATARLPGEAREGWKVLAELCARFGAGGEWSSARDVFHEIAEAAPSYASTLPLVFDDRWGSPLKQEPKWGPVTLQASPAEVFASPEYPYTLARDGAFDWGSDALVSFSPTLSRDYRSERKLFPKGLVEMSEEDAHALRVRAGGLVKLSSAHGDALVPVRLRKDLEPGVVIAPYGFRESVDDVLGDDGVAAVKLERVGN